MSDGYMQRNEDTSFRVHNICTVSIIKFGQLCAQLIYAHTIAIFHVEQTRDSLTKWLIELKVQSYIALFGERNVTFRGSVVGCQIEHHHDIPGYKHILLYLQPCDRVTYA